MQQKLKILKKKKEKEKKQSCHTSHNTKLKGTWEESYFTGTCESSEISIYRLKKHVYVKIICACVYASVEVTKGLFSKAFLLSPLFGCEMLEIIC